MTKLRHYQLSFPEEATEGMNRLAEAFVTLTEACGKKPVAQANGTSARQPAPGAAGSAVYEHERLGTGTVFEVV